MKRTLVLGFFIATSITGACTPAKPRGFGIENSAIRYQTAKFDDPHQLADVDGLKITAAQILDKSPVIKDLDQQRNEALVAMVYLKATQLPPRDKGAVEIALPPTTKPLEQLLARFGRKPVPHVGLTFVKFADPEVVGKLGSTVVKRGELDENNAVLQSIAQRRFTEVVSQLDHQLSRILINERAMKAGQPLQEYIDQTILKGEKTVVTDAELKAHLAKIGFAESELTPELKTQFTTSLAQQKEQRTIESFVANGLLKSPVKVAFGPPSTAMQLSDRWQPVAGYVDAPIALVAFAGTMCPDCPAFTSDLKKTMDAYDGYLKLNWIHNFNPNDGASRMMAQAALCLDGERAGSSLQFLNDFAQKGVSIDEAAFYDWATHHQIDPKTFKDCFVGQKQNERLDQHLMYARQVGVVANPSLWIDGRMLEGVVKADAIERVINERIAIQQISPFSAFLRRLKARFHGS